MRRLFVWFTWWVLLLLAGSLFVACSESEATSPLAEPAPDRPTFVWIFSDP
jgi:hypothetical protein